VAKNLIEKLKAKQERMDARAKEIREANLLNEEGTGVEVGDVDEEEEGDGDE
jgi:hypothetical protein